MAVHTYRDHNNVKFFTGLSTDTKPEEGTAGGSFFYESDTGILYVFADEAVGWVGFFGTGVNAAYGEIYVDGGITNQITNPVPGTHDLITAFNTAQGANGLSLNCSNDKAGNDILPDLNGVYLVHFNISFSGSSNQRYHVEAGINSALQPNIAAERTLGGAGDTGTLAAQGYLTLGAGDNVALFVECGGASKDFLVAHANLSLLRVGP